MTWKRILLLFFGFFLFLLGATYVVLQETGAARTFVRATLSRLIAAEYFLRDAFVNLAEGRITLEDFQLTDPTRRQGDHLVSAQRVDVAVDTNPLGDVLSVQEVSILGLDIKLDLAADRLPTLSELLHLPDTVETEGAYPPVTVSQSTLELGVGTGVPPLRFTDIELQLLPREDDANVMVLTGTAHCENFGFAVTLNGEGQVGRGEFRGFAKATGVPLDSAMLARARPYVPAIPADASIEGEARQLVFWFEYGSANPDGLAAGVNLEMAGVSCAADTLVYPLEGAEVKLAASTREGGKVRFSLAQRSAEGDLTVTGSAAGLRKEPTVDVRITGRDLLVGPKLQRAVTSLKAGRDVWSAFEPSGGRVDAEAYLRLRPGMAAPDIEFDLDLQGLSLTFRGFPLADGSRDLGFPLPVSDTRGRISLRQGVASLHGVTAEIAPAAGGGRIDFEGMVFLETEELPAAVQLDIHCPALAFTPELRHAMGYLLEDSGELYDDYAPSGSAAVTARIRTGRPGIPWQVRVQPLGATATWRGFPYRIDGIHGSVQVEPGSVDLDLQGNREDTRIVLAGQLLTGEGSDALDAASWRTELWIRAQKVLFDASLRKAAGAFAGELEELWQEYSPSGRADFELTLWRDRGGPEFSYDVRVDLDAASAVSRTFPLEARDLYGPMFVHGTGQQRRIEIDTVHGSVLSGGQPARMSLLGTILMADGKRTDDLTALLYDLELSRELAAALEGLDVFRLSSWDVLEPSGKVDVVLRRHKPPEAEDSDVRLVVQLRGVRSDADMLPQPATDIRGELTVMNGNADFRNLRGHMAGAEIVCKEGFVRQHRDAEVPLTEVQFTVSAERFPVNDDLARLFDGPLRQALLDRRPRGAAKVNAMTLTFLVPMASDSDNFETRLTGQFEALGIEMLLGTRVDAINGLITVTDSWFDRDSGWITGTIDSGSFRLFGHPFVDLKSVFYADAKQVTFTDCSVSVHDGFVRSRTPDAVALRYEMANSPDEVGVLSLELEVEGLSLSEFLRAQGIRNSPYYGTVHGELTVDHLRGADFVDMIGHGRVAVSDGNLGAVPLFTAIYNQLSERNRPRFDSAVVDFEASNREIRLNDLVVRSPLITVRGQGLVTMEAYVDLTLKVDNIFGGSADVLVLPPLIHAITSRILSFHVYGHAHDLRTDQRWFTQKHPRRPPLGPVPPRRDPVQRPDY